MLRIFALSLLFLAELAFAMHSGADEFYRQATQKLFAIKGDKEELKKKLAEHFTNAENYKDVAAMKVVPHAVTDVDDVISFLEQGLGTKRGKEPQIPSEFHDPESIIAFATSGLDVMAERLVFLSQHPAWWAKSKRFVALVSQHPHRIDLLDREYLKSLPKVFYKDFDLKSAAGQKVAEVIEMHFTKKEPSAFTHKDGMNLVLDMLACIDENIASIKAKWEFHELPNVQTEALVSSLFSSEELNTPVTFVCTPAGTNSIKQIVAKTNKTRTIDFAISGDLTLHDELTLHLTTPVMHANNLLFNLFNRIKNDK